MRNVVEKLSDWLSVVDYEKVRCCNTVGAKVNKMSQQKKLTAFFGKSFSASSSEKRHTEPDPEPEPSSSSASEPPKKKRPGSSEKRGLRKCSKQNAD